MNNLQFEINFAPQKENHFRETLDQGGFVLLIEHNSAGRDNDLEAAKELYDFIRYLKKNKAEISFIMNVIQSVSQDIMYLKFKIGDICNADKQEQITAMCNSITREAALRFNEISIKYRKFIEQNVNYPAAVLCMATEFWEEIHGRNYRS